MIKAFWLALSFLTVIPVQVKGEVDDETFSRAITFFPVIGLILGCCIAAAWYVAAEILSFNPFLNAVLTVILFAALTRMLHLDGLSDTFDGLLGGQNRDRILEIMKDSRVGSFGVAALVFVLLAKIALLSELPPDISVRAIILFPVCARWTASYALITQQPARENGLGFLFQAGQKKSGLIAPSIIAIAISMLALKVYGLMMLVSVFAFAYLFLKWVRGKIGGITGDISGALIELSEVVALFVLVVLKNISLWL